jgi:Tol biopolymer transport system component
MIIFVFTMKPLFTIGLYIGSLFMLASCTKTPEAQKPPIFPIDTTSSNPPVLSGKLVYHTYSCYSCNDSRLYLLDFTSRQLTCLSASWNITNPMNAHISPDGKKIVFMGMPSGTTHWDIFMYTLGAAAQPVDLTENSSLRDEDPKFSPDGSKIAFKRNGILKEMDTTGLVLRTYTVPQKEASMPYYTRDGSGLLFAGSETGSTTLDIFLLSAADGSTHALSALVNVEEYYPVARDDTSFLFTRWNDQTNKNDQVYVGFYNNRPSVRLPFNQTDHDFSDAFPVNAHTVVLSSTKPGGRGQYDLYIADSKTGKIWSLNLYNPYLNTVNNELGACYWDH